VTLMTKHVEATCEFNGWTEEASLCAIRGEILTKAGGKVKVRREESRNSNIMVVIWGPQRADQRIS